VRTSYADMLSLTSMAQGDIRRALLLLQCWALTGAAGRGRQAAPVYVYAEDEKSADSKPPAAAAAALQVQTKPASVVRTEGKTNIRTLVIVDSDEEFAQTRSSKRRCIQRFPSSEDDSQTSTTKGGDSVVAIDDCSQESCSQAPCNFETNVPVPRTVALSADSAPPIHRMHMDFVDSDYKRCMLTVRNKWMLGPQQK
jgi:hypothetical protein